MEVDPRKPGASNRDDFAGVVWVCWECASDVIGLNWSNSINLSPDILCELGHDAIRLEHLHPDIFLTEIISGDDVHAELVLRGVGISRENRCVGLVDGIAAVEGGAPAEHAVRGDQDLRGFLNGVEELGGDRWIKIVFRASLLLSEDNLRGLQL